MITGADIKLMRETAGLSQEELAKRINKTTRTLQNYETDVSDVPLSVFFTICYKCNFQTSKVVAASEKRKLVDKFSPFSLLKYLKK